MVALWPTLPLLNEGREPMSHQPVAVPKRREVLVFAFLAVVLFPIVAVGVVAGWGFIVWMWQLIAGPPPVY